MNKSVTFPDVPCRYGAPMGRRNHYPETDKPVRLRITRARWVDYDYDQGGAYWGHTRGEHIYCGWNRAGVRIYARAKSPVDAAILILKECPAMSTCGGLKKR